MTPPPRASLDRAGDRACPACGSRAARALGMTGEFAWSSCSRCHSAYVGQEVTDAALEAFYAGYYSDDTPTIPPVVQDRLAEVVASFEQYRTSGRLLDVGFGEGTLLTAAHEQGWDCWGSELSASAIRAASSSWTVLHGDVTALDLAPASFDVVCMVELLEHVIDPLGQLLAASKLLRPGGLLFGTTPSARGVSARLLGAHWSAMAPPEHLQLLSPRGLRLLLRSAGLSGVSVHSRGMNPHELRTVLRKKPVAASDRVESGYRLNTKLQQSAHGRALRGSVNAALRTLRLGDSLRFRAVRAP